MIKIEEPDNLKTYAHIVDGKVVNVSIWDGEASFTPDEELIEIPEGSSAGIDWDYTDGEFVDNRPVPDFSAIMEPESP
jgi:hypothetical protein